MIDVGSKIAEYEIIARLKSGGMATLFLGRRRGAAGFARHVAIKVVHPHLAQDPGFVRMFVDEALLSARIQHPNVVHVEELGEADGTYFLVMEYVHGCALSDLMRALSRIERRMAPELAVWIAMRVLEGLHAAHELSDGEGQLLNVVHRDVSPQNVLISSTGNIKLIDFGIAKARGRQHRTATGSLRGKVRYMAPEQAYGKTLDRRTDVYALGVVLWEMLTMRRMFNADNDLAMLDEVRAPKHDAPSRYAKDVDTALDAVVLHALAPSPNDRPETALALRRELAKAAPRAATLDASHLADVVTAVLGEEIESRRRSLPESLTRASDPLAVETTKQSKRPRVRDEIISEMTHSAPGSKYAADDAGDAFESSPPPPLDSGPPGAGSTRASRPSSRALTPTPIVVGAASRRERGVTIAALGVAVAAIVGAASFVALSGRLDDGGAAERARDDTPPAPPAAASSPTPDAIPDAAVERPPSPGPTPPDALGATTPRPDDEDVADTPRPRSGMTRRGTHRASPHGEPERMTMSVAEGAYIVDDDDF